MNNEKRLGKFLEDNELTVVSHEVFSVKEVTDHYQEIVVSIPKKLQSPQQQEATLCFVVPTKHKIKPGDECTLYAFERERAFASPFPHEVAYVRAISSLKLGPQAAATLFNLLTLKEMLDNFTQNEEDTFIYGKTKLTTLLEGKIGETEAKKVISKFSKSFFESFFLNSFLQLEEKVHQSIINFGDYTAETAKLQKEGTFQRSFLGGTTHTTWKKLSHPLSSELSKGPQ